MKDRRRTSILINIIKAPLLKNIFLVCIVITILFPIYIIFSVIPSFTSLLVENTENEAFRTGKYLSSLIIPQNKKLRNDFISSEFKEAIEKLLRDFRIERLKIFSEYGETIFSTNPDDIGKINRNEYFREIVAKGKIHSKRVWKDTKTSEGQIIKSDVMEIYVPILTGDTFIGAIEIYYDITNRKEKLDKLLSFSSSILFSIAAILFLAVAIILFKASKTIIENERIENKRLMAEQKATELSEFLKKMFGRYLSIEVMNSLLENPSALELGGEYRNVTIVISDLFGFTAISERLEPEQVVKLLNTYFEAMVDTIHQYHGTIVEIVGDSLLIIFGAPHEMPDRAQRAIACAIAMQNGMAEVNRKNLMLGLPKLEMGIGLHDTEVIVGNIGSRKRIKYSVVGSGVNLASRIESYAVGGQILISESVRKQVGEGLRIDGQREVLPKGAEMPLQVYEIGGIGGGYNIALEETGSPLVTLAQNVPVQFTILEGKNVSKQCLDGLVVRLSKENAVVALDEPVELFANLKMNLRGVYEELTVKGFYGKVIERSGNDGYSYVVRFTSVPPEVVSYFLAHQQYAAKSLTR